MVITLRLDKQTHQRLSTTAKAKGVTRSELIRQALQNTLSSESSRPSAWELGKDLFGKHGSGDKNRSVNRKETLRKILHEKHGHR